MPLEAVILVRSGPQAKQRKHMAEGDEVIVGRAVECELCIPEDGRLSRKHFKVRLTTDGLVVEDLGSRNGILVNGKPVRGTNPLSDRDSIQAGGTQFQVRMRELPGDPNSLAVGPTGFRATGSISDYQPPPQARRAVSAVVTEPQLEAVSDLPELPPGRAAFELFRQSPRPVFAVIDAARDDRARDILKQGGNACRPLCPATINLVAPRLVDFSAAPKILEPLALHGWGNGWGIFLTTSVNADALQRHLQHLITVRDPTDQRYLFRFYDPRLLRALVPKLNEEQLAELFGPIRRFIAELDDPKRLVSFRYKDRQVSIAEENLVDLIGSPGA